jgi:UDP-N-acetylglucosamine 2-epimerase
MKICSIVGARPQLIKYFPISLAIAHARDKGQESVEDVLIHTGQHYDYRMSKIFFDELGIRIPDHHLGVGSGTHAEQTAGILAAAEGVLQAEKPDAVVVYGDTNSTLAGAVAAVKLHLPVAHVEAGLRSYNRVMPEEINRILTDRISWYLFCPCRNAAENLAREGFRWIVGDGDPIRDTDAPRIGERARESDEPMVCNTGDVMYDAILRFARMAEERSTVLTDLDLTDERFTLLTMHRAENTDDVERFEALVSFVNGVAVEEPVVFPMHPRTKKVYERCRGRFSDRIRVVEPVSYLDVLMLLKHADMLLTDSGGMQKEAYWLRVPCITLRDETEWIETVQSGWNVLYKDYFGAHPPRKDDVTAYGDGKAAERIVQILMHAYG